MSNRGLTAADVSQRRAAAGPNEITRAVARSRGRIFIGQLRGPMNALLAGACLLSAGLGAVADAVAIGAIVLLNAVVGFLQEHRAERAIQALRGLSAPRARVVRDGQSREIAAAEVVPGDLLLLEAGDVVAADAVLVEAHRLTTQEAALTGESMPVEKRAKGSESKENAPLAERFDHVFMGTAVATGTGLAEVTATGMRTELGRIAHLLTTAEDTATPLQRRLARVSRTLLWLCLAVVGAVAVLGLLQHRPWAEVLMSAVSLAVAAVPEGLAAVVTVALAIGVQRMAARNALVRRLAAVETLGCTTVICTDKTGTLTTGHMAVRELWGPDHHALLEAAAACCDAELEPRESSVISTSYDHAHGSAPIHSSSARKLGAGVGDPTELAILLAAAEHGVHRAELERDRPRVAVHPFDSERKRMSVLRGDGVLYMKGAVDVLLPLCSEAPAGALEAHAELAAEGQRVLAIAVGQGPAEQNLRLLGLIGLADPPRTEVVEAVESARRAGIRTVMITGDHPLTARAIGLELGLLRDGEATDGVVYARATAQEKLEIVRGLKRAGAIVAMTGDGVNDAPALREAHVGVAMGRAGTEVTREAADVVLTDDNYATLVAAVQEGRGIYENIRKTIVYLLAGNAAELAVMLGAALLGLPAPLLPLHLLWINLVTDGLPALALVMDPADPATMQRPPRAPDEPMLGRAQWRAIAWTGALQAAVALSVFTWALHTRDLDQARNLAFSVLVFGEVFRAFAARSPTKVLWELGAFSNLRLVGVVGVSVIVQVALHHVPALQAFFHLQPLTLADGLLALGLGLVPVTVLETWKIVRPKT